MNTAMTDLLDDLEHEPRHHEFLINMGGTRWHRMATCPPVTLGEALRKWHAVDAIAVDGEAA